MYLEENDPSFQLNLPVCLDNVKPLAVPELQEWTLLEGTYHTITVQCILVKKFIAAKKKIIQLMSWYAQKWVDIGKKKDLKVALKVI